MHYLITGHTGFKGAWLTLMLKNLGHTVSGVALGPLPNSLFTQANVAKELFFDLRQDIIDSHSLAEVFQQIDPNVVIHMAAQPLVLESYRKPLETFQVNVMGTLNVLEATRKLRNLKATLVITTDKVYKNLDYSIPYVETDNLGGSDPYSASKAAADIATESWSKSFSESPIAIARAGNVIGGGDFAENRLIPELVSSYSKGLKPKLRNPKSTRPWQHVLDCLGGYLKLVESQIEHGTSGAWNFGPNESVSRNVAALVGEVAMQYGFSSDYWDLESENLFDEHEALHINSTKSRRELGWSEKYDFTTSIKKTIDWYQNIEEGKIDAFTRRQVEDFLKN
jgi:CDP-glucose 4,6-dehydratase